ncbi:hypothetical protein [Streptomyces sp. NPDC001137]|uniref:hypothetical protein n=1 Tax=Streptomyces sp. NPDC001137 TaxID=3154378 RepID=UPI00332FE779
MEDRKDPPDVRGQRRGYGNPAGSNGQGTRSVSRISLDQVTHFRQDAEQRRVQMTSSGLVRTVRSAHGPPSQLFIGCDPTQAARDEPLHADRLTAIRHHHAVSSVAVIAFRFW